MAICVKKTTQAVQQIFQKQSILGTKISKNLAKMTITGNPSCPIPLQCLIIDFRKIFVDFCLKKKHD